MKSAAKKVALTGTSVSLLWSQISWANQTPLPPKMPSTPLSQNAVISKVALGSCFAPQVENQNIFNTIAKTKADVFLYIGDNVYQSKETAEMDLPHLKEGYRLLAQSKSFAHLRKTMPVLPIWDDHDYGLNDEGKNYPPKFNSEKLFEHVWAMDKQAPIRKRPGVYYAKTLGPKDKRLQVIMLDTRFFRDDIIILKTKKFGDKKFTPVTDKQTTMLGEAQWQWLEAQLQQPANLRLVVSSVQVLTGSDWSEGWHLFPHEQKRLVDLLGKHDDVLLLSGDRHFSNIYQQTLANGKVLTELTSSSLNLPITGNARDFFAAFDEPHQLESGIYDANFAMLQIDWDKSLVNMEIRDEQGITVRKKAISFK